MNLLKEQPAILIRLRFSPAMILELPRRVAHLAICKRLAQPVADFSIRPDAALGEAEAEQLFAAMLAYA
ncbi:MAG: hypothetical protein P4K83_12450 [Terracidiphilus sp.]|nr:hypothetical protein [Terracidiphilus sp.]